MTTASISTTPIVNHPRAPSFKDILGGDQAFYKKADYKQSTKADFAKTESLDVIYTSNTETKVYRIAKKIFSMIFFPIAIYNALHSLAGKLALLPASNPANYEPNYANLLRTETSLDTDWKYKRITIEVDGYKIDAAIMGQEMTLNNGRWVLASNGNGEFYEQKLYYGETQTDFKQTLKELKSNAIVFNYPGVGSSSGAPDRAVMAKAYKAVLNFLEDEKNGIGAKEIIGYGHSIGGGVQGEALKTHSLKKNIKYVFIKSRTFSDLSTTAANLNAPLSNFILQTLGLLVKLLGWNISSVESSKKLQAPEIILQTAKVKDYEILKDDAKIIDDGIIAPEASLAKAMLRTGLCANKDKLCIGIPETHNRSLKNLPFLAQKVEELLKI